MSVLRVIRHGQASYFDDDYDALSPIGWEQARSLGRHWLAQDLGVDRVIMGPRRRHRETMEAVAEVFRDHGREWPEPELMGELDEHSGQQIVDLTLPEWIGERPELEGLAEKTPENLRLYFRIFREITIRWVRDELGTPDGLECWQGFRARVTRGLERILGGSGRSHDVAVFTSGGPVATAAGLALDLADEKVLELSWRVRNTAHAELLFSEDGVTLDTFNANPHLTEPRLVTYI